MIPCANPTVVPATQQATYDHWWIVSISINAGDPANVFAQVILRKCFFDANGVPVLSPSEPAVQLDVPQVMQDPDPLMQSAVSSLISAVTAKLTAAGL